MTNSAIDNYRGLKTLLVLNGDGLMRTAKPAAHIFAGRDKPGVEVRFPNENL